MIDGLTLVGPEHQLKVLRQYEKLLPLAKREDRYLAMSHIIIAPYCTQLHPEYVFVFHCSKSHPPRPLRAGTSGAQAVDLPEYCCDGPHRYRPAWRTVKLPGKTHGNDSGQPGATSPADLEANVV